jgi:hypothetical protein
LLVPVLPDTVEPENEARNTLELALPLLEQAAKGSVEGLVGPSDAVLAVERALVKQHYDEVLVSTLPARVSGGSNVTSPPASSASDCPSRSSQPRRDRRRYRTASPEHGAHRRVTLRLA